MPPVFFLTCLNFRKRKLAKIWTRLMFLWILAKVDKLFTQKGDSRISY